MLQIIPTDTCYGLAGLFTETDYLEIYRLKGRDFAKPLAILVEDYHDMKQYIEITDEQIEFLHDYPHPWSFLGRRICDLPEWMDREKYTMLSIRVAKVCIPTSNFPLPTSNFPLFLTSANLSGHPESKTLTEARVFFPSVEGIDGGLCDHPPSDIFSLWEDGGLRYLRRNY
jgi:tRNA A37 threonylcarbamoyladenosine synthetase subunit TsaC/SUA5/YrdC